MRISVNLASRPFVELRPLFAQLRLLIGALILLAIALFIGVRIFAVKAKHASAQMDALKAKTSAVQAQTAAAEAKMRRPENQSALERSQFLNTLFAAKGFSWTGVMMDLERVLPQDVQVTSIDPAISKDGVISIRLRVTGDRSRSIQLVRNLEHSQHFLNPRLAGESALTADKAKALGAAGAQLLNAGAAAGTIGGEPATSAVEFEIYSGYKSLPEAIAAAAKTTASARGNTARESAQ